MLAVGSGRRRSTQASTSIRLDAEAQDAVGNVGYSFNKAVNFQSAVDTTAPSLLASQPLTGDTYTLNQQVKTSFDCSDLGGTASCTGTTDIGGPPIVSGGLLDTSKVGSHTFTITGTDLSGNVRTKSVGYRVLFGFSGFRPPISNPPIAEHRQRGPDDSRQVGPDPGRRRLRESGRGAGDLVDRNHVPQLGGDHRPQVTSRSGSPA